MEKFSRKGDTLIGLLIGVAILVLLISMIFKSMKDVQSESNANTLELAILDVRQQITNSLLTDKSFYAVISDTQNTLFDCLINRNNCCPIGVDCSVPLPQAILVKNSTAQALTVIPPANAGQAGMDYSGRPCLSNCLFRYELFVRPLCGIPCINPTQLEFTGTFSVVNNPSSRSYLIPKGIDKFHFTLIRDYYSIPKNLDISEEIRNSGNTAQFLNNTIKLVLTDYVADSVLPGYFTAIYRPIEVIMNSSTLNPLVNDKINSRKFFLELTYDASTKIFQHKINSSMFSATLNSAPTPTLSTSNLGYSTVIIPGVPPP